VTRLIEHPVAASSPPWSLRRATASARNVQYSVINGLMNSTDPAVIAVA